MTENEPGRRTTSRLEDEGIPDLQDGTPGQQWAEDPQEMAIPAERPVALDDFGTTAEEMHEGESLAGRLSREEPETPLPVNEPVRPAGRIVEDDEGARTGTEKDAVAYDLGGDGGGYSAEERAMRIEDE